MGALRRRLHVRDRPARTVLTHYVRVVMHAAMRGDISLHVDWWRSHHDAAAARPDRSAFA